MQEKVGPFWYSVIVIFSSLGLLLSVNQIFSLGMFGFVPIENSYLYYLFTLYLSLVFLLNPISKGGRKKKGVPWYDGLLFLLTVAITFYLGIQGEEIISLGWDFSAPLLVTIACLVLWVLVLEGVRRVQGIPLMCVCLVFSLYPFFTGHMPGILKGVSFGFIHTALQHVLSTNSIVGITTSTVGNLLVGFLVFGVVLEATGGGNFFFDISNTLFGTTRGGTAKISVVASGLFGMISGSPISNVVTTGTITIPAMKRSGYEAYYAGAIETCAATGGALMPPVMGIVAFVMASFLNIPYRDVCIAAAIPALLYYWAIFIQADCHAARIGLKGLPRSELIPLKTTLKNGWYFVVSVLGLIYLLIFGKVEAEAPFYISLLLIVFAMFRKETRFHLKSFLALIAKTGKLIAEITAILAAIGLVVGAVSMTGVALSFSSELVVAVGNNAFLILVISALASFILGMGMPASACYIFLAIVMVPAVTSLGINPLAAHLFVLYWGIVSYITPPVALAAMTAAGVAQSPFMKTGFTAVRLGVVLYFIPFFFVYAPALVAQGTLPDILYTSFTAFLGVFLLSCGLEGYLIGVGRVDGYLLRGGLVAAGLLIAHPNVTTDIMGYILGAAVVAAVYLVEKRKGRTGLSTTEKEAI
jgi:TRAP transporter 4TM/12TM fusion protein